MNDDHDHTTGRPTTDRLDRRTFLRWSARASVGAAALLGGACSDSEPGKAVDMGADMAGDMGADMARDMAADLGADLGADMIADMAPASPFTKQPFVHLHGSDSALLRFETHGQAPLGVRLEWSGGQGMDLMPATSTERLPYTRPTLPAFQRQTTPDVEGEYTMQDVALTGLKPGERYTWIVDLGDGAETRGTFLTPPPPESGGTFGFISDTMFDKAEAPIQQLVDAKLDLTLHGGDIQYNTHPLGTWNSTFARFAPLMAQAAFHACIGNHEYEGDEFEWQYRRILGRQRDATGMKGDFRYHALTFCGIRFIMLNSEEDFSAIDGPQLTFLQAELTAVDNDPALHFAVVVFHRPFFTFSRSTPNFTTRDMLHPVFVQHNVPLVLTGHNHCYERFEVEGVTYVVDGGGGAAKYGTDLNRASVLAERPGDEQLRKAAEYSHGTCMFTITPQHTLQCTRRSSETGMVTDTFEVGVG